MPQPLDPSQYEAVGTGPQPLDQSQFETLPSYADGSSPTTPVNKSPVPTLDRAKLSMGNDAGRVSYLKKNFEDAQVNPQGDIVVKDQGLWHRVQPKNLGDGDAWDTTKKIVGSLFMSPAARMLAKQLGHDPGRLTGSDLQEIAGKIADVSGPSLDVGGGVLGGMAGAGVASVATAGIGGAGGEAIRTSLGRLAGTYEATLEQQAKDIGWEGLLNAGGQTIALGVKPSIKILGSALKPYTETATNYSKEVMSSIWGELTGAGRWAMRRAMDASERVIPKADEALASIPRTASPTDALGYVADKQANIVKSFAADGDSALTSQWNKDMGNLVQKVPDGFKVNVGTSVKDIQQKLVDSGYGEFVGASKRLRIYSPQDIASRLSDASIPADQAPKIIGENTRSALQEIANLTNQYGQLGSLEGKTGAVQLMKVKRAMGETFSDLLSPETPDSIKRVIAGIKTSVDDKVGQAFANHSDDAYTAYQALNSNYSKSVDAVRMFKDAAKEGGSVDSLVKQLVSKSGSNRALKDEAATVANLMGKKGNMMQDLLDWEAAKGFMDFVPRDLSGNSAKTVTKAVGTLTGAGSPRAAGKIISYGNHALDFLGKLGPDNARKFLSNDAAVKTFGSSLMQAFQGEEPQIEQMLQQAGVK
jgi:hypothetical protein